MSAVSDRARRADVRARTLILRVPGAGPRIGHRRRRPVPPRRVAPAALAAAVAVVLAVGVLVIAGAPAPAPPSGGVLLDLRSGGAR